jgi:peptidoglycan/LPS O-acetylase OafA/YrhL
LYAGPFPVWLIFFVLGLYLGRNKIKTSKTLLFSFVLVGLLISIAETYYIFYLTNSFEGLGIKIGAFIYSFAVILFLFSLEQQPKRKTMLWRFMAYFGRISFGVYLIHIHILSHITRRMSSALNFTNYFFEQLFLIGLTMVICVIIITAIRSINKPLAAKYLGF